MKFKKVEISAFRIFDDPKDATFDLTTKSGNAAGFVSLYAPNGFGKTSFYDAVEFAITNSINRFFIRSKELEKLADFQLIQNEVPLIRNSKSADSQKTYVKIFTDNEFEPEIVRIFKKHGNQTHDLNFNKKPISHEFQKVILSQEWIAAFLTEQNGEYRYEKFMEIPELSSINEYYNKLKQIYSVHETKKHTLNDDIAKFQESVHYVDSKNLLNTVNNQILLLIEKFGEQSLKILSLSSTQEDVKKLKDLIASKAIFNNPESALIQLLEYVDIAKSGNNSTIGLKTYFSMQEANQQNEKRMLELKPLLGKFESIERLRIEVENIQALQQNQVEDKNRVNNVISYFPEYERISDEIKKKNDIVLKTETAIQDVNTKLSKLNYNEIEFRAKLETALRELEESATKKSKLPEIKTQFEQINGLIQKTDADLMDKRKQVENKEKEQRETESIIADLRRVTEEITKGVYPKISNEENSTVSKLVQNLKDKEQLISNENETLMSLDTTIKQEETLNQTLSDFIKAGLSIVNERQASTCPLCEQVYDSYNALVEKITNNNALDETLKTLLAQKSKSELRVFELTSDTKQGREQLLDIYREQLDTLSRKIQEGKQFLETFKRNIKDLEIEQDVLKKNLESQQNDLKGLSFSAFEKQLDESITETGKARDIINSKITTNKEAIDKAKEQLTSLEKQINLLKGETESQIKNIKYVFVIQWFNECFPHKEISKELLLEKALSLTQSISQLSDKLKETDEKIITLSQDLASFKRENLLQEKTELERLFQENDTKLTSYRYFLKDKMDIDTSQLNETTLPRTLEEKQKKYKADLNQTKSKQEEYQKLEKYSENVWPFLQSENAKLKIADAINELDILEKKVEPVIKEEHDKAKTYLDNRIKKFFHEELINKLYRKIDPHPDFKAVEFKAYFDTDNPRLDVFVKNTKNENSLIPNLYFSTAQINILSLSIFLATALNSKDYQCIFIDDPIQSMDSVNVLSTIDLLRTLVVNERKQIILSTHDENFHNLLKKKMPPELFESKFLELESFGKVKIN